ncbi:MAG: DUF4159 domain-containing protein [Planctomycetota bacterium]|jgi:hypothetical protein
MTRRALLKSGALKGSAAALAAAGLHALAPRAANAMPTKSEADYDFIIPRVKFPCDTRVVDVWSITPGGDRNLLEELSKAVHCKVDLPPGVNSANPYYGEEKDFNAVVTFDRFEPLKRYPFLFMTAEGYYTLTAEQKANLKRYVDEGGFLYMDECVADGGFDHFFKCSVQLLGEIFGRGSVVTVPNSHELFHNVYDLRAMGLPHVGGKKHPPKGVFRGDRVGVFLTSTDIHCGWTDRPGRWYPKGPGRQAYKEAIEMGINIAMYAMTH